MPYARIAITLPADVLASLDRRAKASDRSRSRVIVDAIRAYLAAAGTAAVREPTPAYGAGPIALARRDQLERDLARTPAERLAAAAELASLAHSARRRSPSAARRPRQQIISFDSYEDFYEWKNSNRA